jgi:hypothetical protein
VKTRLLLVAAACALALVPFPARAIERWYANWVYPPMQRVLTAASNLVPIAVLDVAVIVLLVAAVVRLRKVAGWRARLRRAAGGLVVAAAVVYILFALLWGLNYQRERIESKVAYDPSRVTRDALVRLASGAAARANAGHAAARAQPFDAAWLERALGDTVSMLGAPSRPRFGVPKRSILQVYFRRAAIDGMTVPWFLEIVLNPDLLGFERPFVVAHEWAHLAGYAHESEANFIAWLACLRGDALARYSASLAAYQHAWGELSREERKQVAPLDAGPRADLRAAAERYRRAMPFVRDAWREVYDSYLRAHRVEEGIDAYDAVVRLMVGTDFTADGVPRLRPR